eukprot:TRINITY_DN32621_c0_g1_i1.p1 TRINITY_DN32621_c0_g1~~TRINITY_DN32621_c0_g1_i1.p1  ORF type:complete len:510 (-),score=99.96 TRINITY_DN32621_c0_g1_i1:216-1745(-)
MSSAVTTTLCKCLCGNGRKELLETQGALKVPDFEDEEVLDADAKPPSAATGSLTFSALPDQPLRGAPIRTGELWYLSTEEKVEPVTFSLHVNGFLYVNDSVESSISLSPFALVRNCRFQSSYSSLNLADFKIFKVSLFTQGVSYYYGVKGSDERKAEDERSRWVLDLSRAIRLVTQSLFPTFSISCEPLRSISATHTRLMAGYLVHHEDTFVTSVLYCELHPQQDEYARLTFYENESCQTIVMDFCLTERSICCEKVGINCSCFCIEDHQFSTRTVMERKLWLRAISNVKVKIQNHAPTPCSEELHQYRAAIKDHLLTIKATLETNMALDPLLQRYPRRGTQSGPLACLDHGSDDDEPSTPRDVGDGQRRQHLVANRRPEEPPLAEARAGAADPAEVAKSRDLEAIKLKLKENEGDATPHTPPSNESAEAKRPALQDGPEHSTAGALAADAVLAGARDCSSQDPGSTATADAEQEAQQAPGLATDSSSARGSNLKDNVSEPIGAAVPAG